MKNDGKVNNGAVLSKLGEVSFFKMFADDEKVIKKIAQMCKRRTFRAGTDIIKEGDFGDELYIILKGEIDILKKTIQNEKYTVTRLNADMGAISVGELAMIDNDRRSATVNAVTPCDCIVLTRNDFIKFGNENPLIGLSVTREIACQLSLNLRKANTDVITLFSALVDEIGEV